MVDFSDVPGDPPVFSGEVIVDAAEGCQKARELVNETLAGEQYIIEEQTCSKDDENRYIFRAVVNYYNPGSSVGKGRFLIWEEVSGRMVSYFEIIED